MGLADEILQAFKDHENSRPRSQQITLGPSEFGGCREYLRNVMVGSEKKPNDEWPAAAAVGTLFGDYAETIVGERLDAVTQVPVTTTLPNGITVSGHGDAVFPERNLVVDFKSKDGLESAQRGGPSLEHKIQLSIYMLGLTQAGILTEGATGHLIYGDRAGNQQFLHEEVITWEQSQAYIETCVSRIDDVLYAQEQIDAGDPTFSHQLRDKTPSFCFSKKVMCPFRDLCWQGSEWKPDEATDDPDAIEAVHDYVEARAEGQAAISRQKKARARLESLMADGGMTPDGTSVVWSETGRGTSLYVTDVSS